MSNACFESNKLPQRFLQSVFSHSCKFSTMQHANFFDLPRELHELVYTQLWDRNTAYFVSYAGHTFAVRLFHQEGAATRTVACKCTTSWYSRQPANLPRSPRAAAEIRHLSCRKLLGPFLPHAARSAFAADLGAHVVLDGAAAASTVITCGVVEFGR